MIKQTIFTDKTKVYLRPIHMCDYFRFFSIDE